MFASRQSFVRGNREFLPLMAALFVLALIVRTAWLAYAQPVPWSDYEDYHRFAQGLLDHQQLGYPDPSGRRLPGLPAFLAAMMLISRSLVWLSFSQVVLSALLVPIIFELTRRLTDDNRRLAMAAGLATAINPTLIAFSPILASEHLFALLLFSALLVASRARPTVRRAAGVGVLTGAAILTRGESIFYLPLVAGLLALGVDRLRERLVLTAAYVSVCAALVAPWYARNLLVLGPGAGLSTNSGLIFYYAHNDLRYGRPNRRGTPLEGLSDVEAQRRGFELGLAYLKEDPTRIFTDVARGTKRLYWPNDYAVDANVRSPRAPGEENWPERDLAGRRVFSRATRLFYLVTLLIAPLFALGMASYPLRTWLVVAGVPLLNWLCYGVVFMADGRYRFLSEVVFGAVAAAVVAGLWIRFRVVEDTSAVPHVAAAQSGRK